jgi:hypothetical protein
MPPGGVNMERVNFDCQRVQSASSFSRNILLNLKHLERLPAVRARRLGQRDPLDHVVERHLQELGDAEGDRFAMVHYLHSTALPQNSTRVEFRYLKTQGDSSKGRISEGVLRRCLPRKCLRTDRG